MKQIKQLKDLIIGDVIEQWHILESGSKYPDVKYTGVVVDIYFHDKRKMDKGLITYKVTDAVLKDGSKYHEKIGILRATCNW